MWLLLPVMSDNMMPEAQLLCALVPNQISETALGEAEKDSFIALPSKRRHTGFCFERLCVPTLEEIFFFWPCNPARVVPRPGIKFTPPALEAQSFNH